MARLIKRVDVVEEYMWLDVYYLWLDGDVSGQSKKVTRIDATMAKIGLMEILNQ